MFSQVHKNIGITVKNYFIIAIKDADTTPVFLLIAFVILFFVLYIVAKIKEYVESKIKKEADKRAEYLVEERKRDIDKEILRYIEQRKNEEKEHKARNLRNIISICDKIKKMPTNTSEHRRLKSKLKCNIYVTCKKPQKK